ncbi:MULTISPECIES: ATP-grasp domain-containing protein [Geobacillus]|uniref:ATP-grasp domain-containing protein n=1 Tax=Geobacillus TaxID=129337 RepID=UPI0005CD4CD9|nr:MULTISPECIES: ATP-grasp domain-containing protein [Geobacillus]TWG25017.1 biotin carboxylase [Geobacillus sp. C56-T2]
MLKKTDTIVLIGWRRYAIQRAKELGLYVIYIEHNGKVRPEDAKLADEVVEMDYRNIEQCVAWVKQRNRQVPIKLIISFAEDGLIPAAKCNEALGICWNSVETVELLKNKWKMRDHLSQNGFSSIEYSIGKSLEDIRQFYFKLQRPIVIKPIDGTASQDIYLIRSEKDIEKLRQFVERLRYSEFLIEEYLEGEEFSIETMSFHGEHLVLAITDKKTFPNFVEKGHTLPTQLPQEKKVILEEFVKNFLTIIGLKEGPAHTEVKWTPYGPRIIESHNRIGGDKINELYKLAYKHDMLTITFAWAKGLRQIKEPPQPVAAASIQFISLPPGRVVEIEGVEQIRKQPFVSLVELSVKVNDEIKELRSSWDRVGCIICSGKNPKEAINRCEEMIQQLKIKTIPVRDIG